MIEEIRDGGDPVLRDLLKAICQEPNDDGHRTVFADRCEELGLAERADFIRVQLAKGDLSYMLQYRIDKHNWQMLVGRCEWANDIVLAYLERQGTYPGYSWGSSPSPTGGGLYKAGAEEVWVDYQVFKLWVRRGFLDTVQLTSADFLRHACALFASQPVRKVTLTTWPAIAGLDYLPNAGVAQRLLQQRYGEHLEFEFPAEEHQQPFRRDLIWERHLDQEMAEEAERRLAVDLERRILGSLT